MPSSHIRFPKAVVCGLAVLVLGSHVAFAGTLAVPPGNPLKSFIHHPICTEPYVGRLTQTVTQAYLDRKLIHILKDVALVKYQQTPGSPVWQALFLLDDGWSRIAYSEEGSDRVRGWGRDESDAARNLRWPVALTMGDPNFAAGDRNVPLFVTEMGRVSKLNYSFEAHTLSFVDSLSADGDSIGLLSDGDLDDNGTPGDPGDDSLWVLDKSFFVLDQYACNGSRGVNRIYSTPYGEGPGQVSFPRRIAMGRNANGSKSNEIYVLEMTGRLQRFLLGSGSLIFDALFTYADPLTDIAAEFGDVTVDRWGQIYVTTADTNARILKLDHGFNVLAIYDRSGFGPDEIYQTHAICNPRRSIDYPGWGELLVGEEWSLQSGGQAFSIGVSASSGGYHVDPETPVLAQLEYFATDPHYLRVEPYVWDSAHAFWLPLTPVNHGLKYSGLTNDVFWSASGGPCGSPRDYKFVLWLSSTYGSFYDTLAIYATLGDGGSIRVQEPLTLGSQCFFYSRQNSARRRAQPSPCVGGTLQYSWSSNYNKVRFWVDGIEYVTYTGPRDSVGITIQPPATGEAAAEPDTVGYFIHVDIADRQQHHAIVTRSIEYCACPACPWFEDITADGVVNAMDIVLVIDMVYRGAPSIRDPGCPKERGDFDCDGYLTVFDVILIIDVVFSGSQLTCDPCQSLATLH